MSFCLPAPLAAAIETLVASQRHDEVARRLALVSTHYRQGRTSEVAIATPADVAAYLSARMPATYAAVCAALSATRELMPDFSPLSLLDLCAGPGTASFAALSLWPEISALTLVDTNPRFLDAARSLGETSGVSAMREAKFIRSNLASAYDGLSADVVMMSYALVELPLDEIAEHARRAWELSRELLLFVEPGTPEGFRRILICRDALIEKGAHLVAPCPHLEACPMPQPAWCHFTQRLARSRRHRLVKAAQTSYEDEPFIYLAFARTVETLRPRGRLVSRARVSKAQLRFGLCRDDGHLVEEVVARRDRERFARLRHAAWGDALFPDGPRNEP